MTIYGSDLDYLIPAHQPITALLCHCDESIDKDEEYIGEWIHLPPKFRKSEVITISTKGNGYLYVAFHKSEATENVWDRLRKQAR